MNNTTAVTGRTTTDRLSELLAVVFGEEHVLERLPSSDAAHDALDHRRHARTRSRRALGLGLRFPAIAVICFEAAVVGVLPIVCGPRTICRKMRDRGNMFHPLTVEEPPAGMR